MNPVEYIQTDVTQHAVTYDVYRLDEPGPYNDDPSKVDTVNAWVFAGSVAERTTVEGTHQETALTGLIVPEYDNNGDLVETVEVGDELRLQSDTSKRYDVKTKEGHPDHVEPDLWVLGIDRANAST